MTDQNHPNRFLQQYVLFIKIHFVHISSFRKRLICFEYVSFDWSYSITSMINLVSVYPFSVWLVFNHFFEEKTKEHFRSHCGKSITTIKLSKEFSLTLLLLILLIQSFVCFFFFSSLMTNEWIRWLWNERRQLSVNSSIHI